MTVLSLGAALALAATCQNVVDPQMIVGIAQYESGLNPGAISKNQDGSRDFGLMQINERNLAWLGLSAEMAMDPCQSIAAAGRLLASYSRYNTGTPAAGFSNSYVANVISSVRKVKAAMANPGRSTSAPIRFAPLDDEPADATDIYGD